MGEWAAARARVQAALARRYRAASSADAGAAHDAVVTAAMHPLASEVVRACLPGGQRKPFPANNLSLMTVSGAKGSTVNFSQISALLGQQVRGPILAPNSLQLVASAGAACFPRLAPMAVPGSQGNRERAHWRLRMVHKDVPLWAGVALWVLIPCNIGRQQSLHCSSSILFS